MRFINSNPDKKRNRKLKAIMWLLILLTIGLTVGGVVLLYHLFVEAILAPVIIGVILIIVIVKCFYRPIKQSSDYVDILRGNIGVCEQCGRYFNKDEVYWKLDDIKEKTMTSEKQDVTEYTGTIYIEETCPNCGTKQTATIYVDDLGKYTETYKSYIWNDYIELHKKSESKSTEELARMVESRFNSDVINARYEIGEYESKGFVLQTNASVKPFVAGTGKYNVVLTSVGHNKIAVIKTVRDIIGIDIASAKNLVESAPVTIIQTQSRDDAEFFVMELVAVGADAEIL